MRIVAKGIDGAVFRGRSAQAIVRQMKRSQWSAPSLKTEYMEEVAERVFSSRGKVIRTSPPHFLHDLEQVGMLELSVEMELRAEHVERLLLTRALGQEGGDVASLLAEMGR